MTAAIRANDLFFVYQAAHGDVAALRGLSLDVGQGEIVAVLGPSGAGKSTLLSLCAGSGRPTSGQLTVLGVPVGSGRGFAELRRRSLAVIHQHYHESLPRELTAEEIVALPLRLLGRWGPQERARVERLLRAAGLGPRRGARPSELSGGEQQRVAVCAALAKEPRLLLADEPTGELDEITSEAVIDLLIALTRDVGASALLVSHDPLVSARSERTIHLRDGRVSAEGTAAPTLVLDEQGWLRVPSRLREEAGVSDRVRARATSGRIELLAEGPKRPAPVREGSEKPHWQGGEGASVALEDVTKSYGSPPTETVVLHSFTQSFAKGKLHVVAGPSGSGKTTLLHLVAGLEPPDRGNVHVDGEVVSNLDPDELAAWRRRTTGFLSQHSTLVDFLSVRENVELGLLLRGSSTREAALHAEQTLRRVGLDALGQREAGKLSGGEQRRVALARALAPTPRLLLADEPTAHLDRLSGRMVIRLLQQAVREASVTVIAVSHDADLIEAADFVLPLEATARPELSTAEKG